MFGTEWWSNSITVRDSIMSNGDCYVINVRFGKQCVSSRRQVNARCAKEFVMRDLKFSVEGAK